MLASPQSFSLTQFGSPLELRAQPVLPPQGHEVVLKVHACGLCHSDLHLYEGYFDLGNGVKADASRAVNLPRILGHEIVGEVIATGPEVEGVTLGARRVIYPWLGCGACDTCAGGAEHLCSAPQQLGVQRDGGFASVVRVPHERYLVDFGELPEEQACTYACSGLTAYAALKKLLPFPRDGHWMVIGAGGVGLSGLRLASAMGLPKPIVAELDRDRWDMALEAGAAEVIDPRQDGIGKQLRKMSNGGLYGVVDFVGAGSTFSFGLESLRMGGRLVSVGLFGGVAQISPALLGLRAISVLGSLVGSLEEMREVIAIAKKGALPQLPVATRPMAEVNAALADLKAGHIKGRVVLRP